MTARFARQLEAHWKPEANLKGTRLKPVRNRHESDEPGRWRVDVIEVLRFLLLGGFLTKNRIFAASYERGIELIAAGCPLDYPDALARRSAAQRKTFRAQQLAGYAESCIYPLGELQTGYLIGLRLESDRPDGTVISAWSFAPPWQDHIVIWDYEPQDIIPSGQREAYRSLFDSRLTGVLNERRLLRRGYPVEGLLCGCSAQPVADRGEGFVYSQLSLVDDRGNEVTLPIATRIVPRAAYPATFKKPADRLIQEMHERASEGDDE